MMAKKEWNVTLADNAYSFKVMSVNREQAEREALKWLRVDSLPAGTEIWRYPENPWRD